MKIPFLITLVGLAISFALPTFAQQKETVDPNPKGKICTGCGTRKPLTEYHRNRHSSDGRNQQWHLQETYKGLITLSPIFVGHGRG